MMPQILKYIFHTSTSDVFWLWLRLGPSTTRQWSSRTRPCKNKLLYQEQVYTNVTNICNITNRTGKMGGKRKGLLLKIFFHLTSPSQNFQLKNSITYFYLTSEESPATYNSNLYWFNAFIIYIKALYHYDKCTLIRDMWWEALPQKFCRFNSEDYKQQDC